MEGKEIANIEEREDVAVLKSALQKCIRRGWTAKAMYFAYKLSTKETGYVLWRRLKIISVEDVGLWPAILVTEVLSKWASSYGYESWDGRRCAVCCAKILSEMAKDRRADEFLELMNKIEKGETNSELIQWYEELSKIPDIAFDCHTKQGRAMGRGDQYWIEVSSETENRTVKYAIWREWWKGLMLKLLKRKNTI